MIPKNRIHLSRLLHAQTTPYPEAGRWIKRGIIVLIIGFAIGIYFVARPGNSGKTNVPNAPKEILGQQVTSPQFETYTVKRGDTLFNISQKYSLSWQTLADVNNLQEPYILKVGQQLKIPQTKTAPPAK